MRHYPKFLTCFYKYGLWENYILKCLEESRIRVSKLILPGILYNREVRTMLQLFHNKQGWCHGMTELIKVHRKTNRLKISLTISCVSLISLIEIWPFCTNLLENYPSHNIDQLPLLRILSLYMDHSVQTRIQSLYLFLLFLFMPLALFGQNDVRIHALVCTIVYSVLNQA